jgi:A/G-specific adenine glycosylase
MTVSRLQNGLLDWYRENARLLPWRETRDPYAIWVSEIMLQQTQAETVIPYYRRFIKTLPDLRSLAQADLGAVLKLWEGLGYYARARNLHKAAEMILENLSGDIPADYCSLKKLPGIGDYTAAAIASIAFGESVAVLDGNAKRVYARWIALKTDPGTKTGVSALRRIAEKSLHQTDPGTWNQAVMELGAILCSLRAPGCSLCPVKADCLALKKEMTEQIPRRKKRKRLPHYQVTAGVIWHQDALLIARRKEEGLLGGLWEFPGGKLEDGETLQECLERELAEELEIKVEVGERLTEIKHAYTHFRITLHAFNCSYISGPPQALGCAEWRWIQPAQLDEFAFPRADRKVIEILMQD